MMTRTVLKLVAGIASLAVVSLGASTLQLRAIFGSWSLPGQFIGDAIFLIATLSALVWSTGLARTRGVGGVRTGALALLFGVLVLVAASLLVETLWPSWSRLAQVALDRPGAAVQHDAAWFGGKVALAALYALPFAVWRTLGGQRPLRVRVS
jgi:hypothetical protein